MRKEILAKKVFAVAMAATLAAPMALNVSATSVEAAKTTIPEPIAAYNFETAIDKIEGAEVANSETIYVVKAESELAEGEKIDANGLVYTGEGKDAKYITVAPIGAPSIVSADDKTALKNVLEFDDTMEKVDEFQKKISAKTDDMSDETAKYLDFQIPKNDYYYVKSGSVAATPIKTQNISPELKLQNPFAGLADELKEFEETEDVNAKKYSGKYVPDWKKGITITYWIKVPVDEKGAYQNSSVLRWENDNEYYLQADDYSKYLPTKLWNQQYAKFSDKETAFTYSPSGVFNYGIDETTGLYIDEDGLLDFYFDYAGGYFTKNEDGTFKPVLYIGDDGSEGPVYDYALIQTMQATLRGKTQFTGSARFFFANPNYKDGFYVGADGSVVKMFETATYASYSKLPQIVEGDKSTSPTTSYVKLANADQQMSPADSQIRYALEDGELQIDADDSAFWVPDNVLGINENSNVKASYGTKAGMQNADVFFMNSWTESRAADPITGNGTYASASYVAHSPVSTEDGEKNKNAGKWHHVAITMQNDWVEFYVDGKCVEVEDNYSSRGATTLDTSKSFKRFNKGAGMRNGAGSEKNMGNIAYGNYVCRLLMDWISDENSVLCLGGIGNYASEYAQATTTSKVCLDELKFYKEVLDEDQIKILADDSSINDEVTGLKGDLNGDNNVQLDDALLSLKIALGITDGIDPAAIAKADVNNDGQKDLADTLIVLRIALGIEE